MDPEDPTSAFHPDDDTTWFDKNVDVGQSASSLTESTDHDELSTEFTQDELNAELTQSELTNDDDLLTEKMDHQDHDVLSQGVADLQSSHNDITSHSDVNLEQTEQIESDDKTSQSERLELERELLEESNLSLEGKKDDITKELTDIFFQTEHKSEYAGNDLNEEVIKDSKIEILDKDEPKIINDSDDHLLTSQLENEAEMSDESLKNELTNILDEDKLLNPELESKAMDVVQELQEHINLVDSQTERHDETISMEPNDIQKSLDKICLVTKDIDCDLDVFECEKKDEPSLNETKIEMITDKEENEDNENDTSETVLEKFAVNTIGEEQLSKEPVMVEFTHDTESRAMIKLNEESNEQESPSKFVVSDTKQPVLNAETIVMETEEGEQIVFNAEVISTENNASIMNVEGGAEFLEAVTGNMDDLLEPEEESEPVIEAPVVRKKPEQQKCFVMSCKSGKTGSRTSFRYFKPPITNNFFKKWQTILTQSGEPLTPDSMVCELHFKAGHIYKKSLDETGTVIWGLREGALPTVHNTAMSKTLFKTVNIPKITKMAENPITPTVVNKNVAVFNSKAITASSREPVVKTPKLLHKPIRPSIRQIDMNDPDYILQNPDLIKNAQDETLSLDVLVCGDCRTVFHFVEDFSDHKSVACNGKSTFKANPAESKPQVWAFLLWKSAQAKVLADIESPWKLYQRWCKMDDNVREAWVTAGKVLMDTTALAHKKIVDSPPSKTGSVSYTPAKPGRPPNIRPTPVIEKGEEDDDARNTNVIMRKVKKLKKVNMRSQNIPVVSDSYMENTDEETRMEEGGGDATEGVPEEDPMETDMESEMIMEKDNDIHVESESQMNTLHDDVEIKEEVMSEEEEEEETEEDNKENQNVRDRLRVRQPQPLPIIRTKPGATKQLNAKPDDDGQDEEEFVVEKIVSRRYNSKKRQFEYLLKWEGYPSEQNTWEPAENMATCQHLLKAFEANLVKQQQAKQAVSLAKTPIQPKKKPVETVSQPGPSGVTSQGRPDRRSKQKAMDQVKVWCGSMKPTDDEYESIFSIKGPGLKRKVESDSDFDEDDIVPSKKVKIERDNENIDGLHNRTPAGAKKFIRGGHQKVGRPEGKTNLSSKPALNGFKKESNLAAALGLESDSENDSERANVSSPSADKNQPVVRKMSSLSVQNQQVLVANAKGVVKVDPSQVPNLTSGVYIMSNTSGIVKVDNMSSKNALSSLQKQGLIKKPSPLSNTSPPPLVMVGPKDGNSSQPKSGIIRRPQPVAILPKPTVPPGVAPTRPLGLLKPMRSGIGPRPLGVLKSVTNSSPRLPGIPSGLSTKIQGAVRPKGTLPSPTIIRPKAPNSLQKPSALPLQKMTPVPKPTSPQKPSPLHKSSPLQKPQPMLKPSPLPKSSLQKSPLKPIESILGGGLQASQQILDELDLSQFICLNPYPPPYKRPFPEPEFKIPAPPLNEQKILLTKKKNLETASVTGTPKVDSQVKSSSEELVTRSPIMPAKKILSHPLVFRNRGRGLSARGGLASRGRGGLSGRGSSLGALLRMDQNKDVVVKESKLVENDNLLMEFREDSDSNESDDGALSDHFPDLNEPIEPESPPRPLSLCPLTGKVLCKAEGEKTPEPTPPPSPEPPPPPPPLMEKIEPIPFKLEGPGHPTSILPDEGDAEEEEDEDASVMKGIMCKVEMSPGGTTGTVLETGYVTPAGVTEGTVTIKRSGSPHAILRGPQLSVLSGPNANTSLGTITVPARKIFQDESGTITTDDDVVTITGEDGLVYQVSNADVSGNTILMSSGEDGQQQCVYVTAEATEGGGDESTILTLDTAYADAVAQLGTEQFFIKEDGGDELVTLEGEGTVVSGDDQGGQVVAQLVEAGEPAPGGGPRRVVLLLPDGNLMMTEVDEEQYAALDLDKCKFTFCIYLKFHSHDFNQMYLQGQSRGILAASLPFFI